MAMHCIPISIFSRILLKVGYLTAMVRPAVLLVQEVQSGGGGEKAVKAIVKLLNGELLPGSDYRCHLSPKVATDSPPEHHMCVWDARLLGEAVEWDVWRGMDERAPLGIGKDEPTMVAARKVWGELTSDRAFDRAPAFARFSQGVTIGAVHHARSPALKVKAEAIALQALLGAAAKGGRALVLCGDFNVDEADGGAGVLWKPGASVGDDEPRFKPIRKLSLIHI